MLTRLGVGVRGGMGVVVVFGLAARRLRMGVAGASGFLKTASPVVSGRGAAFDALAFLGALPPSLAAFAERFRLVGCGSTGSGRVLKLATLVERRRDMATNLRLSMRR